MKYNELIFAAFKLWSLAITAYDRVMFIILILDMHE